MIHRYSLDDVTEQSLLSFDLRKTVFAVVAEISMSGPTGLPGGRVYLPILGTGEGGFSWRKEKTIQFIIERLIL